MYLNQKDLFWEMSKDFVQDAMGASEKVSMEEGQPLFSEGAYAEYFYVLIKGRVQLNVGESGRVVYIARHAGEIIGWSSLIGRENYSAGAKCIEPASLLKFDSNAFLEMLKKDTANEAILFRRLSKMLGNRLLDLYPSIT